MFLLQLLRLHYWTKTHSEKFWLVTSTSSPDQSYKTTEIVGGVKCVTENWTRVMTNCGLLFLGSLMCVKRENCAGSKTIAMQNGCRMMTVLEQSLETAGLAWIFSFDENIPQKKKYWYQTTKPGTALQIEKRLLGIKPQTTRHTVCANQSGMPNIYYLRLWQRLTNAVSCIQS